MQNGGNLVMIELTLKLSRTRRRRRFYWHFPKALEIAGTSMSYSKTPLGTDLSFLVPVAGEVEEALLTRGLDGEV